MEFNWTQEHIQLYGQTLKFAQTNLSHVVHEGVHNRVFPYKEWNMCGKFGLLGLLVPKKYDGMGFDTLALITALVEEAFGRRCKDGG